MHRLQELVRLHRQGIRPRAACRLLTMSPKTELKYRTAVGAAGLLDGDPDALPSMDALRAAVLVAHPAAAPRAIEATTDRWDDALCALFAKEVRPQAAWDKLRREDSEFAASYHAVKRRYQRWKRERGVLASEVVIPVDTAPGEVAQVDFGYVGTLFDEQSGKLRKAWAFVMTLGFSRLGFVALSFDQRADTWLDLHRRAFEYFGGVPRVVVPDNLKAAVVRAAFGAADRHEIGLHRSYRELARFYGFRIDPTPVRAPKKKGKVESNVRYVKSNWLPTCEAEDFTGASRDLRRWLDETANARIHGSTRQPPRSLFEAEERARMLPLPAARFEPVVWKHATVHPDSHVEFERRLYSVPWRLIGKKLWLRATPHSVEVYADDTRVATHDRKGAGRRSTDDFHLPVGRRDLRHRSESYWLERADRLGDEVGQYVRAVLESDDELSRLRDVQAIVTHLETFPVHRARAAAQRAHSFDNYSYAAIRRILRDALDLLPPPNFVLPAHGRITEPRFARSARELLAKHHEAEHEPN
ncbi:MAG: IS21 family transposase [Myxococcales bacterium]|nr:IS21 family transposase [Myxococcales bacterium]